jgi:hypothetical protein
MANPKMDKKFPYHQMSDEELHDPMKRAQFDLERQMLQSLFPQLLMNPLGPGEEDDPDHPIPTKIDLSSGDGKETVIELDLKARQNPNGDVFWIYPDQSDLGGHGHFAYKDFQAGDVILRINEPLVSVPDTQRLSETCSNCFLWEPGSLDTISQKEVKMKACTGCKVVRYCGKVGQVIHAA